MDRRVSDIFDEIPPIAELQATDMSQVEPHFLHKKPFVVRGLVQEWPLVKAAKKSNAEVRKYLLDHDSDRVLTVTTASESCQGRIFYDEKMEMNITMREAKLPFLLEQLALVEEMDEQPVIYLGSIDTGQYFKGLREANTIDLRGRNSIESIWIGTRTCIAAHNDYPDNLACVTAGKRRFTLFPPECHRDLYIGPLENTPAGRPVSLVNLHKPDFDMHPRFRHALDLAMTAILEPGDAIFIPSLWWHHVDGLAPFNILVNYWWQEAPRYFGQPQDALFHAILAVRDLPVDQKDLWQDLFNHYVFENDRSVTDHVPFAENTILTKLDADKAAKIRAYLLRALNK